MNTYRKFVKYSEFIDPIFCTSNDIGNWFGYYNYDPLNSQQNKMLCQRVKNENKKIDRNMQVECGYYEIPSGEWHHIGYSDSYNWPQGCMLQWIRGKGNNELAIYNRSKNNHLISTIYDPSTGESRDLDWSIYGVTPDGKKSITLNMERSYWCRAYHYYSVINEDYDVRVAEDDGIFEIDLQKNTRKRIVSISDIIAMDKEPYFDTAKHWIEHIMISPNGKRFCFLHRFSIGEINKYETRVFIANIDGTNLQVINGWKDFRWSHFGWNGEDAFAIYAYKRSKMNRIESKIKESDNHNSKSDISKFRTLIKKGYYTLPYNIRRYITKIRVKNDSCYQYYKINENKQFKLATVFDIKEFKIDGHPSFTNDCEFMITDTYPDLHKFQHLYIYDIYNKKVLEMASVKAIVNDNFYLCDLHPKLSRKNEFLMIDAAYNKKHHMILFRINWDRIKKALQ